MTHERLASLIHVQTATIAELEDRLSTHEIIRRMLALGDITANQAIDFLAETAEHSANPLVCPAVSASHRTSMSVAG